MTSSPSTLMRALVTILKGAVSIAGIQAINFLTPLLALPIILRALEVSQFGKYTILLSYEIGLTVFVDFSFNIVGPIQVQEAVAEGRMRTLLFESIFLKISLAIPASLVFLIAATRFANADLRDIIAAMFLALSITFTPRWVVYGIGKLTTFAAISALSKFSWLGLVIWLIKKPDDLFLLLAISVVTQLVSLLLSFVIIWPPPGSSSASRRHSFEIFRTDWSQFNAVLATLTFRELGIVVLSATSSIAEVSDFALADRVRTVIVGFVAPIMQALFLVTIRSRFESGSADNKARQIANCAVLGAAAMGGICVYTFAGSIVLALGGGHFDGAASVLRILSFMPLLTTFSYILGPNTLLAAGIEKPYASYQVIAAVTSLPVAVCLCYLFGAEGAAWSAVTSEVLLACLFIRGLKRVNLLGHAFGVSPMPIS